MKTQILQKTVVLLLIFAAYTTNAQINTSSTYTILHSSGLYLSTGNIDGDINHLVIANFSAGDEQQFQFSVAEVVDSDTYYYIKQISSGRYISKIGGWNTKIIPDTQLSGNHNAQFKIVSGNNSSNPNQKAFQVRAGGHLGTDGTTAGSGVWSDKGVNTNSRWEIIEYDPNAVNKVGLENLINEANAFITSIVAGTEGGEYPVTLYNALLAKIVQAEAVLDDVNATQSDVNLMIVDLQAALDLLKANENPVKPNATKTYNIIHSSGQYMQPRTSGDTNSKAGVYAVTGLTDQQFKFVPVTGEDGVFFVLNAGTNEYLYRSGWEIRWMSTQPTNNDGKFKIYLAKDNENPDYVKFQSQSNTNYYWGTDNNNVGTGVSADKNGNDIKHYFKIQEVDPNALITTALEDAISAAEAFYNATEEGNDAYQYPASARVALLTAIQQAQTLLQTSGITQNDINNQYSALNLALETYKASINLPNIEAGRIYKIKHVNSLAPNERYIGRNGERGVIQTFTGDDQIFLFHKMNSTVDEFNFQQLSTGEFFAKDPTSSWQNKYMSDFANNNAKFSVENNFEGSFYIKAKTAGYLGTDNSNQNSEIAVDKGRVANARFILLEVVPNAQQIEKAVQYLPSIIAYALITEGNFGENEKNALLELKSRIEGFTSGTYPDANGFITLMVEMNTKIDAFLSSEVFPHLNPQEGENYFMFMTKEDGVNMYITQTDGTGLAGREYNWTPGYPNDEEQMFFFEEVAGKTDTYIIRSAATQRAMNGNPQLSTDAVEWTAQFYTTLNGTDYYHFVSETGNYMYFQHSPAYTHAVWNAGYGTGRAYLIAIESETSMLKKLLKEELNAANVLYGMTRAGTAAGEYPQSARDTFRQAIDDIQLIYNNPQTTLNEFKYQREMLSRALTQYKNAINIPEFNPETTAKYRILPQKDSYTKYFSTQLLYTKDTLISQAYMQGNMEQMWEFEAVSGVTNTYLMKNETNVLTYEIGTGNVKFNMKPFNAATAPTTQYVKFVYADTDGKTHYYYITTADQLYTISLYNGEYLILERFDTTNSNHPVRFIKANPANDVNKTALDDAIKKAENIYVVSQTGTNPGQYSVETYNNFKNSIDEANVLFNSLDATQEDIDNMVTTLSSAINMFEDLVYVDIAELRELLNNLNNLLDETIVGEKIAEYYQSCIDAVITARKAATLLFAKSAVTRAEKNAFAAAVATFVDAKNKLTQNIVNVLADAISSANALHNRAVEGAQIGEYPAGSKAIFKIAIETAEAQIILAEVTSSELRSALDELTAKRKLFENGIVKANFVALQAAIADAEQKLATSPMGDFNGQYPESAFDALQQIIDDAEMLIQLAPESQNAVDSKKTFVEQAILIFESKIIVIDFTILQAVITKAQAHITNTNAATGSALEQALNTLEQVTTTAGNIVGSNSVSQTNVNDRIAELELAIADFLLVLKADLRLAFDKANELLTTTNVESGSELENALGALNDAVVSAKELLESNDAFQSDVNAELVALNNAINNLLTILKRDLQALIVKAKGYTESTVAENGTPLKNALENLKTLIAEAEGLILSSDVTQESLQTEEARLLNALITFISIMKSELIEAVYAAEDYLETTDAGTNQQLADALDELEAILETAYDLLSDEDVTQTVLKAKADEIIAAIENVKNIMKKPLQDLADEAQRIHDEAKETNEGGQYPIGSKEALQLAVDNAIAILNWDDATQDEYNDAYDVLREALDDFLALSSGVNSLYASGIQIHTHGNELFMKNIDASINVVIYNISGKIIYNAKDIVGEFSCILPAKEMYIVYINGSVKGVKKIVMN